MGALHHELVNDNSGLEGVPGVNETSMQRDGLVKDNNSAVGEGGSLTDESESETWEVNDEPQEESQQNKSKGSRRSVRFSASNESDDQHVTCLIQEYEKEDDELRQTLFWTSGELFDNFQEDRDCAAMVEPYYYSALKEAYAASSKAVDSNEHISLDMEAMAICTRHARGLEMEMCPVVKKLTKKHRSAVLIIQDTLRHEGRNLFDDTSLELVRKASKKYSRSNRMMATRMAELDEEAKDDDFSGYDSSAAEDFSDDDSIESIDASIASRNLLD